MRYRVTHRTEYTYDAEVTSSYGSAHVTPRALDWQRTSDHRLTIEPVPGDLGRHVDAAGNDGVYFHVTEPHDRLVIEAVTDVDVVPTDHDPAALEAPWEQARPLRHPDAPHAWAAAEFAIASPKVRLVPEATAYAAASLTPGRPVREAVGELMHRIKTDFRYDSTATTVTSTVSDVLAARAGVCQDFAHLALAGLRGHGVAARYVSGYLATQPPPGKERMVGADASHAWVAVWLPGTDEWLAFDPTNDMWVAERHVTVAWGRDYGDVPPVKGVIFTEAKRSTLHVSVDVAPLD
ncbi:transglutaminase family protein [Microbacterium sp. GXF7504]